MGLITVRAFIVTSDPIQVYGGVAFAREALDGIANDIRTGEMPFHLEHDDRRTLHVQVRSVEVRQTDKGSWGVWLEFDVDEEEWKSHDEAWGGLSVAVIEKDFEPDPKSTKPGLKLAADAGQFEFGDLLNAQEKLTLRFAVSGGRLYQFAELPAAKVIIELALMAMLAIPPNLLSSVLYDALKSFLKPKHAGRSIFSFHVKEDERSIHAHLETNDADVLRDAIGAFRDVVVREKDDDAGFEFDTETRMWRRYR